MEKVNAKITKSPKINKIFHHNIIFIFIFNKWGEIRKNKKQKQNRTSPNPDRDEKIASHS